MGRRIALVAALLFGVDADASGHYFHPAMITSAGHERAGESCVVDSPLGIFTVSIRNSFRRTPHFATGPVRVAIEPASRVGDRIYFLDENDKEYKAVILQRNAHPAPPAVP